HPSGSLEGCLHWAGPDRRRLYKLLKREQLSNNHICYFFYQPVHAKTCLSILLISNSKCDHTSFLREYMPTHWYKVQDGSILAEMHCNCPIFCQQALPGADHIGRNTGLPHLEKYYNGMDKQIAEKPFTFHKELDDILKRHLKELLFQEIVSFQPGTMLEPSTYLCSQRPVPASCLTLP
ncbi:Mitogen-activated protein kinase 3, partial [Galemys pyrenaicus]